MMLVFIIVICVVYYTLGLVSAFVVDRLEFNDKIKVSCDGIFGFYLAAAFCLGIIPIGFLIYVIINSKYRDKMQVEIESINSIYNKPTISYGLFVNNSNKLCFGFPDNNYYGIINRDIRHMDKKELDKAMDMINDWWFKEKEKLNAITEIYKQK